MAALLISLAIPARAENVSLTSFGTSGLTVDTEDTTASYTQAASTLTFTAFDSGSSTNSLGGTLAVPQDWSTYTAAPYTNFGLTIGVGGANPNASFSLTLLSSGSAVIATYGGATTGLTSPTPVVVDLSRDSIGTGDYSNVASVFLSWNDSMSPPNTVTVGSLVAVIPVPEPAIHAMAFAGLACGGFSMWRRRKRA
jgi:hypothetical protein